MSLSDDVRKRLAELVDWHREQAEFNLREAKIADVVDHGKRAQKQAKLLAHFHEKSAKFAEAILATVKDDALAFIDAADELYSACMSADTKRKYVDSRQRAALEAFATASNQWKQHPRKCT